MERVRQPNCLLWNGTRTSEGYGVIWEKEAQKNKPAHRWAWEKFFGPIPSGFCICHHCDNPPCINPDHLFLGTNVDNTRDRTLKGRTASGPRNGAHTHPERRPAGERHGRHTQPWATARGERAGRVKLTTQQVLDIRAKRESIRAASNRYGVGMTHIKRIRRRAVWTHV